MKKILKRLLIFGFIFTCFMATTGKEVNAASDTYVREFDGAKVEEYKNKNNAPIPELTDNQHNDWIFAGWYTNEACTTAMTTAPVEGTKYYAKFVPSEILNVKCQVTSETDWNSPSSDLRLVSSVDSLRYEEVGFEISYNGGKAFKISTDTVYRKIEAGKGGVSYGYSPNIFDLDSEYFITATLKNINNANFYKGFYIKAYWVTLDGTTVYGTSRYARVEDNYLNIANVPVRFVTEAMTTAGTKSTVTFTYDASKFTYAENYESKLMDGTTTTSSVGYANGSTFDSIVISNSVVDNVGTITITGTATNTASLHGEIVHLRLKADDVTSLPRKNTFQVNYTGDEAVTPVEGVYDYLSTAYSFADKLWFTDNPNATEYVIATPNELAGLATIVNAGEFAKQTVYLGADIELNQGDAKEWAAGTNTEGLFEWTPIGINGMPFKGTFDGQGHSITGMYATIGANTSTEAAGLFGYIKSAKIQNLSLENSLTKITLRAGSFVAWSETSELINLYSNAIVQGTQERAGGIASDVVYGGELTNCWFTGQVTAGTSGKVGGLMGRACIGEIKIKGCLNSGSVYGSGQDVGGLIGWTQIYNPDGPTTLYISDCLNVGDVDSGNTSDPREGALIGRLESKLYIDDSSVHATTQSTVENAIGAVFSETAEGEVVDMSNKATSISLTDKGDFLGDKAYQNTGLDFDNTWVARIEDTPVLSSWCESGAIYKYDTEWSGEGTEQNPYVIKTANELYGLAQRVNAGETFAGEFIKLGANITINSGTASAWEVDAPKYSWIPIGKGWDGSKTGSTPFKGTFDGQGYSIRGMYAVNPGYSTDSSAGLFGLVIDAEIKNMRLINGFAQMTNRVGSFVATAEGTTFENLYSDVHVKGTGENAGGLVGSLTYGSDLINCWFDGTVDGYKFVGGLVGRTCAGDIKITGCLNSGNVTSTGNGTGGFIGYSQLWEGTSVTISNSLNVGSVGSSDTIKAGTLIGHVQGSLYVDKNSVHTVQSGLTYAFAYFEATLYDINKNLIANTGNENRNKYVAFTSEENLKGGNGYLNTGLTFDRPELPTPTEGTWVARNGDYPGLKNFVDADDRMELVGDNMYRADTRWYSKPVDQDGVTTYTIRTAEDLVGLAKLVNAGTTFVDTKVVLADDITINAGSAKEWAAGTNTDKLFKWTPIGWGKDSGDSGRKPFQGIFDGQGHSISGMYAVNAGTSSDTSAGLFGLVIDAEIKNIRLTNGFAQMTNRVGSFVATAEGTTFENLYSNVHVKGTGENAGGLVGSLTYGSDLINCWFNGTVDGNKFVGGLVGRTCLGDISITDCLNSGKVSSTFSSTGGFIGYLQSSTTSVTLSNSLNAGSVINSSFPLYTGALIGYIEGSLYVNKNSVHTVSAGPSYAFAFFSGGTLYDIDKNVIADDGNKNREQYVAFTSEENLKGANGYLNTGLTFDRPELPTPTEGIWVAREGDYPALKMFVDADDRMELVGDNMYRADTSWYNTTDTEFVINTVEELVGLSSLVSAGTSFESKTIKLGKDLVINKGDAKDWSEGTNTDGLFKWTPIGMGKDSDDTSKKPFQGIFDGQGHSISGMYAVNAGSSSDTSAGLFGLVIDAEIKNIRLTNGFAQMTHRVGSFVATAEGTTFENLYSDVHVKGTGQNAGGLVGSLTYGSDLINCWFDGTVDGYQFVGGLAGRTCLGDISITGCLNSGKVSSTFTSTGGFIGYLQSNTTSVILSNSLNVGSVSNSSFSIYTGALIGYIEGSLYVDENSVHTVQAGPSYAFAFFSGGTLYDIDKNVIADDGNKNREQYIPFTAVSALHDLKAYNIVNQSSWTARVDSYPIPSVFANGDYANAAKVGSEYVIDISFEGSGTEETPYEISSAAELYGLAFLSQTDSFADTTFQLTANITVNPVTIDVNATDGIYYKWLPIGNADYPFEGKFTGTFIENGYTTISGLYKEWERENNIGLFAQTATQAEVKDFNLTNTYFCWSDVIEFNTRVGAIVGRGGGTFENIHSSAHVTSGWYGSGGILGQVCEDATIINCWYDGIAEGLRPDGSSYTGGMVGYLSAGTLTIKHSLVSGSATAYKNVGGFVGGVRDTGSLILEDNLFSGNISGGSSGYVGQYIGSVECTSATVPQVTFTACYGVSDDVTEDIGMLISKTIDGVVYSPVINGKANASVKSDRLIGYTGTENGLDYTTYWALTKNSTPGLQTFTADEDVYDGTGIDALLQLTYWDSVTIANAEDKGTGNYMITIKNPELGATDGSTAQSYYGYLKTLGENGFTAYSNDNGLNGEGIYNAIYTMGLDTADTVSDDWVVNVTYISYEENDSVTPKIYITFNTGQPLSKHLKAADVESVNYSATDGSTVAQDNVTYHMLESSYEKFGAGSYIMQLKNGHFIIIDGGIWNDVEYLFKYLESLVPEDDMDENGDKKKPIVEAWVFSHSDSDHMGPMLGVMKDVDTYKNRIYVEGFYYNEPNGDVFEAYAKDANWYTKALRNCASDVFKTTQKDSPKIYRMQTGQRYTFGDVAMDIMLSQELLTMDDYEYTVTNNYQQDAFNDTSTWCMFTIDGQKLLSAGDGSESSKKYVVNMYSDGYMTVDVFTALHHGLNTNASKNSSLIKGINPTLSNDEQEDFSKKCTVNKLVLYSYKHNMLVENTNDTFKNGEQDVFAVNWKQAEQNRSFIAYLESKSTDFANGISVLKDGTTTNRNYLYFGEGACKLTFNGDTITATVAPFTY